jgi:ATP-binding cassette subfamily C (CFTR/MRP) protein 1
MAKLGYSALDTKEDGELTIDPNETKKEAKIRVAQAAYDDQRRRDPTLETSVRGPSMWFSYLSMSWLSPFMALGALKKLETTDIAKLTPREDSHNVQDRFTAAWEKVGKSGYTPTFRLWWTIYALVRADLWTAFLLKSCESLLSFVAPVCLQAILLWLADENAAPPWFCPEGVTPEWRGYYYVVTMSLASLLRSLCMAHQFNFAFRMAVQLRSCIIIAVYQQSLRQALHGRGDMTTGKVVNLMASDANRLHWAIPFFHWFPSAFFQLLGAMYFLYAIIGGWPLFAAVAALVASLPLSYYSSKKQKQINDVVMAKRDVRVGRMNELLSAIKLIKSNAWETGFKARVQEARQAELKELFKFTMLKAMFGVVWEGMGYVTTMVAFTAYSYFAVLSADVAFPALALFDILRMPMIMMPNIVGSMVTAHTAVGRVAAFLSSACINEDAVRKLPPAYSPDDAAVRVKGATFTWGKADSDKGKRQPWNDLSSKQKKSAALLQFGEKEWDALLAKDKAASDEIIPFALDGISLEIKAGQTVAVVGGVGAGKSSLLAALLGEMETDTSYPVERAGSVAYAAQSAFIVNATVKENIVFGRPWDERRYEEVLDACCLRPDLKTLTNGDASEIGEQGINLSGGQKQRLSLARAVYCDADIVLLDDVLSAVDAHVGAHIWTEVICKILATKTVVLVTHAVQYLPEVDQIFVMQDGKIKESGNYNDLLADQSSSGILAQLVDAHEADGALLAERTGGGSGNTPRSGGGSTPKSEDAGTPKPTDGTKKEGGDGKGESKGDSKGGTGTEAKGDLTGKEKSAKGQVKAAVYRLYLEAASVKGCLAIVGMFMFAPLMDAAQSYWLVFWSEDKLSWSNSEYLHMYNVIGITGIAVMFIRQYMRTAISIRAAKQLHDRLLDSVLASPMSFFHTTPQGRVLNRFSNDIGTIDESLFESLCDVFRQVFPLATCLLILGGANWIFIFCLPPLTWVYYNIQVSFVRTGRSVKRLDSVTRSPIFAHFAETLNGIVTVRAFGDTDRFSEQNLGKLDGNACCLYTGYVLNRWLQIRTQAIVGVAFTSVTAGLAVLFRGNTDPAVAGMAIKYSIEISRTLSFLVRSFTTAEMQAVSVERVHEYVQLESEASQAETPPRAPPSDWPRQGRVEWVNVSLRYRKGLEPALNGVNCLIEPGWKIGVCGRTGAGKSSMTVAMLRLADEIGGQILIDGVPHASMTHAQLRSKLAIIPQEVRSPS